MKQVERIKGWQLRDSWVVTQWLKGRIESAGHGMYSWHPRPGDRLYYIGHGREYGITIDYYLLRRRNGGDMYLMCLRTSYGQSFLDVAIGEQVPQWVLDKTKHELGEVPTNT